MSRVTSNFKSIIAMMNTSAFMVTDPVARRALEAVRLAIVELGNALEAMEAANAARPVATTTTVPQAGITDIEAGANIDVASLGEGRVRISATGGEGGGGTTPGATRLSQLNDVSVNGVEDGQVLEYNAEQKRWVPGVGGDSSLVDPDPVGTLGSNNSSGVEAADPAGWTSGGNNGLAFYAMQRICYNPSGSRIIYGYLRKILIDTNGRVYSVGPEIRVSVNQTVGYP